MGEKLRRIQRAYAVLARCNQLIVHDTPADELYDHFCRIAVELAGYRMAWVGLTIADEARSIRPVAHRGFEEGYLSHVSISWGEGSKANGPTGRAIRERRPVVSSKLEHDPHYAPWRDEALKRGYASSVALPLMDGVRVFGALNVYAVEPDAFDASELSLLIEVAADLSFGVRSAERRKALERAVQSANRVETLAATVRAASGAIHDLNNMLTVVKSAVCEIRAKLGGSSAIQAELADIDEAVSRSSALARQTLQFAAQHRGADESIRPEAVVARVWPMMARVLDATQTASIDLQPAGVIKLDSLSLEQVLLNLVTNARDAMPNGGRLCVTTGLETVGEPRALSVGVLSPGRWSRLTVEDTGEGMSPEVQQRIFEPFFTTRGSRGTGVGLPVVFAIVNRLGGGIDVHSKVGAGTRFEVFFPCQT